MKIKVILIVAAVLVVAGVVFAVSSNDCETSCTPTKECPAGSPQCCNKK